MLTPEQASFTSEKLCNGRITLCKGNRIDVMRSIRADSIDSIVTDPPSRLSVPYWTAALHVLKPGGRLAAMCLRVNYPRMACAVEDADFEICDMLSAVDASKTLYERAGGMLFSPSHLIISARKPLIGTASDRGYPGADDSCYFYTRPFEPVEFLRWLVRLVTSKGGIVLDPFGADGSTAEAALREGCSCVLVEQNEEHRNKIKRRFAS
jgi:DNA modification methylase